LPNWWELSHQLPPLLIFFFSLWCTGNID
jgi:hypothetical protein